MLCLQCIPLKTQTPERMLTEYHCLQYMAVVAEVMCSTRRTAVSGHGERQKPESNSIKFTHLNSLHIVMSRLNNPQPPPWANISQQISSEKRKQIQVLISVSLLVNSLDYNPNMVWWPCAPICFDLFLWKSSSGYHQIQIHYEPLQYVKAVNKPLQYGKKLNVKDASESVSIT